MKCPRCGKSLWFARDICPFCKTAISPQATGPSSAPVVPQVAASVGNGESADEGLVTLKKCASLVEVDMLREQLEAAGITVFVPDEVFMQVAAWNLNTYGFIRVQVPAKDRENARLLLEATRQEAATTTSEPEVKLAELPLSWPMRWLALVLPLFTWPGLFAFAVAKGGYSMQGCDRKATELWHWFAGGIALWVIVFWFLLHLR